MFKSNLSEKQKGLLKITEDKTIKDALLRINQNLQKCLIVVDKKSKLKGTISDGNIRRGLLKGLTLEAKINKIYNKKNIIYLKQKNFSLSEAKKKIIKNFHNTFIGIIPIINEKKIVKDFFTIDTILSTKNNFLKKKNTPVVIMSGGKGSRLKPFTEMFPKPLVPVGNKTAIDHIIDNFLKSNFDNFIFSINYKSKLLKAYLQEKKEKKIKINYIQEKKPLGTAGSLRLLSKKFLKEDFFVINCDTILNLDYQSVLEYHKSNKNYITLVVSMKEIEVPYGVCLPKKDNTLNTIYEKPKKRYLVNTGLYVVNSKVIKFIPNNRKFDFDEFIKKVKSKGFKIGLFPIEDNLWKDIGSWNDFNK